MDLQTEIRDLQERIQSYSGFADLYNKLGIRLTHAGRYPEAKKALERALSINPNYFEALCNLAAVYIEEKLYGKAAMLLEQAEKNISHYHWVFFLKGQLGWRQKDYSGAEKAFLQAITSKPDFSPAYTDLGLMYQEMGKIDEAHYYLNRSSELKDPDEYLDRKKDFPGPILARKARTAALLGQDVLAERLFLSAIELNPTFPDLHNCYAEFLLDKGRTIEARPYLNHALALNPRYREASMNLVRCDVRDRNYQDALEKLHQSSMPFCSGEIDEIRELVNYLILMEKQ